MNRLVHGNYEYAGFFYQIFDNEAGEVRAVAHKDQHKAAFKDRHVRAAAECFNEEYQWDKREHDPKYHI